MDEEEGGDKMKVGVQGTSTDIGDNNINTDCDDPMSTGDISVQMEHVETLNSKIDDNQQTDGSGVTKKTSAALPDSKDSKLCGWLHITTNKGPLKINRLRWFAYSDTNSRLYFYRNPHDFLPLGEIDISHATFYFDPSKTDKPGGFEIRSV